MKSLFSCFSKQKSKTKIVKNGSTECEKRYDQKSTESNNQNVVEFKNEEIKNSEQSITLISSNKESLEICNEMKVNDIEEKLDHCGDDILLNERLNYALNRIENVFSVLNLKNKNYDLKNVIEDFKSVINVDLSNFIVQSELLEGYFAQQSSFVTILFCVQSELLTAIDNKDFSSLNLLHEKFKESVININGYCSNNDLNYQLNRIIADSIMIFGWVCCADNPANYVSNILDGSMITIAQFVNNSRYTKFFTWLRAWSYVLKVFSEVVRKHFEVGLMWKIDGPVPMDIIKCLVQCNYSNLKDELKQIPKPKVIKTTAVNDISYETVTNLFDDLRSGKQKSRLKSIKKEEYTVEDLPNISIKSEEESIEPEYIVPLPNGSVQDKPYIFQKKRWIIENQNNNPNIEITNKNKDNSVFISNCNDCSIQLDGVIDNLKIDNSSNINVIIDDVLGDFTVLRCSGIESQILGAVNNVNLEEVSTFRLFISKEGSEKLEMLTHKSDNVELYVSNDGGGGLEMEDYDRYTVSSSCRTNVSGGVLSHNLV